MSGRVFSRRDLLAAGAGLGWLTRAHGAAAEPACHDPNVQKEAFEAVSYTEASDNPREVCQRCKYFKPMGRCGNCSHLKGMVNPNGGCEDWELP